MNIDIRLLYEFTKWANDRVFEGAKQLSEEQLMAPIRPGFASTLGLLVHMMAAERVWLSRWHGVSPARLLGVEDVSSLAVLEELWLPLRAEMMEFVTNIDDPDQIIAYRDSRGGEYQHLLWPLVMHVINHGTEHRSQVALYLAMHGIDVGNLDLVYYLREIS